MELRRESPLASGMKRSGCSPPSPVLLRPPMRFMAIAIASWASLEMEPKDMAPVLKRLKIASSGSTSSSGMERRSFLKPSKFRRVYLTSGSALILEENFLYRP
ncbi:hypothetical protein D3C81_1571120 [compost metagenome]